MTTNQWKQGLLALVLIFAAMTATVAQGQGRQMPSPEQRAAKSTEWMTSELSLDEGQAEQVQAINLKYAEKVQALRGDHEAMQQMKEEKNAELKGVLTENQYTLYLEKAKERGRKGKGQGRGAGRKGRSRN